MHVFVYGTLTEPERVASLVDSYVFVGPAVCEGLHPVEGAYPTLAPGGAVAGRLLRTEEIDALDAYEGVDEGLYVRVSLPYRGSGPETVETYVGDPEALGVADPTRDSATEAPGDPPADAISGSSADSSGASADPSEPDDSPRGTAGAPAVSTADALAEGDRVAWPGDGSFADRVARYVERERPFVRPIDPTDGRPTGV